MACNWVKNVQHAGVREVLIGALDQGMMDACAKQGVSRTLGRGRERLVHRQRIPPMPSPAPGHLADVGGLLARQVSRMLLWFDPLLSGQPYAALRASPRLSTLRLAAGAREG